MNFGSIGTYWAAFTTLDGWIALLTLTAMEIVLGIDNIIFIAILVTKLPKHQQAKARQLGIGLALISRLALLFSISWVMGLTEPLFQIADRAISGRDLILLGGGAFLIAKATFELHEKVQGIEEGTDETKTVAAQINRPLAATLIQIILIDIVFSLDSVVTAVGMAQHISIMIVAMVAAVGVMLIASGAISDFVHKHATIKILALAFLVLIGVMLLMEGMGNHVNKGYIYFAMAFAFGVEMLNLRYRKIATNSKH